MYKRQAKHIELDLSKTKVIITTTKGGIDEPAKEDILDQIGQVEMLKGIQPMIISNACVSGVMGIIQAANLLEQEKYSNALVIGVDFATDFILSGFESLHALSENECRPYDEARDGINLSDCIASVFMTTDPSQVTDQAFSYMGGASANDANHISGPSRNGEGLVRSVNRALEMARMPASTIDYISAHGTATRYNDEMESIAFERLEMSDVPVNSLKGYFGHTLGAAGVLEVVLALYLIHI